MKAVISSLLAIALLSGCAASQDGRGACAAKVDLAWERLNIAETEGFAGSVSYSKAAALLSAAKFQQTIERYDSCIDKANRSLVYIDASMRGE